MCYFVFLCLRCNSVIVLWTKGGIPGSLLFCWCLEFTRQFVVVLMSSPHKLDFRERWSHLSIPRFSTVRGIQERRRAKRWGEENLYKSHTIIYDLKQGNWATFRCNIRWKLFKIDSQFLRGNSVKIFGLSPLLRIFGACVDPRVPCRRMLRRPKPWVWGFRGLRTHLLLAQ